MILRAAASVMKAACKVLSWHRGGAQWRLSSVAACLLSLYVLLIVYVAAGILAFNWPQRSDQWWVFATTGVHIFTLLFAAAASLGYIYVSWRAARSSQLHLHGLVLLVLLTAMPLFLSSELLISQGFCALGASTRALNGALWAVLKTPLFVLMREKMMLLGPLRVRGVQAGHWAGALIVSSLLFSIGGVLLYAWGAVVILRGVTCREASRSASAGTLGANFSLADKVVVYFLLFLCTVGAVGIVVSGSGTLYAARNLRRRAVSRLVKRQVLGEELTKVKRTLDRHIFGMFICVTSLQLVVAVAFFDGLNLCGDGGESQENFVAVTVGLLDILGDVVGILLLSGIGVLLVHEDPLAGDISAHICSLLHSAVLTGQAEMIFEGRVDSAHRSRLCIASFPGRYMGDWHTLTWACEQGELSSACVFLPKADTLQRFGKHAPRPETPGRCWCYSIYGEEQMWGCMWWDAWQKNVERAAELGLELVAVFFPGEAGKGIVPWEELGTTNLWDGVGLGGSQKSEVAYMRMRGFRLTEVDLETFRRRVHSLAAHRTTDAA